MAVTLKKWDFEPHWDIAVGYHFATVVERSQRFWEQRRPLLLQPFRSQTCEFIENELEQQRLYNTLTKSLGPIAVPIYVEAVRPTSDLQGLVTLPVGEDLSEFWHFQRAEIVLIRSTNAVLSELKLVSQVNPGNVVVSSAVAGAFVADATLIYPCFPGIILSKQITAETSRLFVAKIEFKEIFIEWQL